MRHRVPELLEDRGVHRARAARSPSSRRSSGAHRPRASRRASTRSGSGASPPSSTACPTSSSGARRASYTDAGQKAVRTAVDFYMENARIIRDGLRAAGFQVYGGENAPYIWVKTPPGLGSWAVLRPLLTEAHVVGTPGVGLRAERRGLLPLHRLRPAGPDRGSGRADPHAPQALAMPTPLSVYLPFNLDCLGDAFVPAKSGAKPDVARGRWLLVQDQRPRRDRRRRRPAPAERGVLSGFGPALDRAVLARHARRRSRAGSPPCPRNHPLPDGLPHETLAPIRAAADR